MIESADPYGRFEDDHSIENGRKPGRLIAFGTVVILLGTMAFVAAHPSRVVRSKSISAEMNLHAATCHKDTGGTCRWLPCNYVRHATCDSNLYKCVCGPGECAIDGSCVDDPCPKKTNFKCGFRFGMLNGFNCPWKLGPVDCSGGNCRCQRGLCSSGDGCVLALPTMPLSRTILQAKVAPINKQQQIFPGRHGKLSTALCISGGGMRALTLAAGQLRAFEALGLMSSLDAISSVSGGTWAAALYMYSNASVEELLGPPMDPIELTLEALGQHTSIFGSVATRTMGDIQWGKYMLKQGLDRWKEMDTWWGAYVGMTVLEPVNLSDRRNAFLVESEAHKEDVLRRNPHLARNDFLLPNPARKQLLVMCATLLAPRDLQTGGSRAASLQMSPDFAGSPFLQHVEFTWGARDKTYWQGGGLEETFAFGDTAPIAPVNPAASSLMNVSMPDRPFSLQDALAASSDALAAEFSNLPVLDSTDPEVEVWPIRPGYQQQKAHTYKLGDGGNLENSGVLPMLQRKVKKIVWLIQTDTGIAQKEVFDWCAANITSSTKEQISGNITNQVFDKFGYGTDSTVAGLLSRNQVFPSKDLFKVACELRKKKDAGKPAVLRTQHLVQENTWWGIDGNWSVDLVYVYNEVIGDFVKGLPYLTQLKLNSGGFDLYEFKKYPFLSTVHQHRFQLTAYTWGEYNLLSAQGEYMIRQNNELFTEMLKEDGVAAEAVKAG